MAGTDLHALFLTGIEKPKETIHKTVALPELKPKYVPNLTAKLTYASTLYFNGLSNNTSITQILTR